jgi:hypothetical protein
MMTTLPTALGPADSGATLTTGGRLLPDGARWLPMASTRCLADSDIAGNETRTLSSDHLLRLEMGRYVCHEVGWTFRLE